MAALPIPDLEKTVYLYQKKSYSEKTKFAFISIVLEHFSGKFFCFFHFYCVAKPTRYLKLRLFINLSKKKEQVQKKRTNYVAMALRSSRPITKSVQTFKELEKNMLSLNSNVLGHHFYLRNQVTVTNPKYFNKLPYYKDVKGQL